MEITEMIHRFLTQQETRVNQIHAAYFVAASGNTCRHRMQPRPSPLATTPPQFRLPVAATLKLHLHARRKTWNKGYHLEHLIQ